MRATTIAFVILTSVLSFANAGVIRKRQSGYQLAAYWGQEPDGDERSLGDYCASDEGIDILIVSFLSNFGNGVYPNGYLGDCAINADGSFSGCSSLATDIATCKSAGKKVFVSVGGAGANFDITGTADASGIAYSLWYSYANPAVLGNNSSPRPFGNTFIDGWDFDIEAHPGDSASYLGDLVNALRGYFSSDSSNSYYIGGAPQCPMPEANMGQAMMSAQFDYLWIQFYNNNCAAAEYTDPSGTNPDGNGQYNFADWPSYLSGGASANAQLLVGLPASTSAADTAFFYVEPSDLPSLLSDSEGVPGFGGVMIYDAGDSDTSNTNGCNYAQEVRNVLDTGSAC